MPYCRECGKRLPRGTKFCNGCGAPISLRSLRAPKRPRARTKAPQNIERTVIGIVTPIVAAIVIIAVLTTITGNEGGEGPRGTPPSAMLTVTAENGPAANEYTLTISHEGGDDLAIDDLEIMATDDNNTGAMETYPFPGTGTFSVGNESTHACEFNTDPSNEMVTVFIIHTPSKQKIFSSSYVVVR